MICIESITIRSSSNGHPHVRAGAAIAFGISCAGTGLAEAIDISDPLLDDLDESVKQAAMIAMESHE
jgi:26S proteasome regulatory subunit N2